MACGCTKDSKPKRKIHIHVHTKDAFAEISEMLQSSASHCEKADEVHTPQETMRHIDQALGLLQRAKSATQRRM